MGRDECTEPLRRFSLLARKPVILVDMFFSVVARFCSIGGVARSLT